jgi:hypothetical protein
VVERRWRPFAGNQERRRFDRLGVRAPEWRALLLDLAKQGGGVVAKHPPSVFWRPVPAARPGDHVNYGLETLVDLAASNSFGRLCVDRAQRDCRWRRPKTCLDIRRQHASRLNEDERADEIRIILRCPESDMPAPGVTEQMSWSGPQRGNEARDIRRVLLHGEIIAFAVPFFRPAMPEADGDCAVIRAERLHLARPMAIVAKRAVNQQQRRARSPLGERHVVAIHPQSRHELSQRSGAESQEPKQPAKARQCEPCSRRLSPACNMGTTRNRMTSMRPKDGRLVLFPVRGLARPSRPPTPRSKRMLFLGKTRNMCYVFPLRRIQTRASPAAGREMGSKKETRWRRFAGRRVAGGFLIRIGHNPLKRPDSEK